MFYELGKQDRDGLVILIRHTLHLELEAGNTAQTTGFFGDEDTYIRKAAYIAIGRIYLSNNGLHNDVINLLSTLLKHDDFKVRQTAINAAGEIGKTQFEVVQNIFDIGLFDIHHSPRNAVIGSVKKMGEVNPEPVLNWARQYLHHPDKEIRREICHGIELRGRKYPNDILPLLKELENDNTARVKNTLVHVLGQIAYKKGCLQIVIDALKTWTNKELVSDAMDEIMEVHHRYRNFSALTQQEAIKYIETHWPG